MSLKSKPVIAGVFILLAVVVVINLRTFGVCLLSDGDCYTSAQHMPPVPTDLQLARESMTTARPLRMPQPAQVNPQLARDPFLDEAARRIVAPPPTTQQAGRKAGKKPSALACSAILLGGKRPTALINGKAYGPGDRVGRYQVVRITTTKVELQKSDGQKLTLWAVPKTDDTDTYKVVTLNSD